jgi:hypothetical protein
MRSLINICKLFQKVLAFMEKRSMYVTPQTSVSLQHDDSRIFHCIFAQTINHLNPSGKYTYQLL